MAAFDSGDPTGSISSRTPSVEWSYLDQIGDSNRARIQPPINYGQFNVAPAPDLGSVSAIADQRTAGTFGVGRHSFNPATPGTNGWPQFAPVDPAAGLPQLPGTDRQFPVASLTVAPESNGGRARDPGAFDTVFSDISLGLGMPVIGAVAFDVATRGRYNATGRVFTLYGRGAAQLGHGAVYAIREFGPPTAQATQRLCQTVARAVRQTAAGRLFP